MSPDGQSCEYIHHHHHIIHHSHNVKGGVPQVKMKKICLGFLYLITPVHHDATLERHFCVTTENTEKRKN